MKEYFVPLLFVLITVDIVFCQTQIRFAGPNSNATQGRLEVFYNGVWGTVCNDNFDTAEAIVICRINVNKGSAVNSSVFGPGTGPILLDDVNCDATELDISQCQSRPWNVSDCQHNEDVGVICDTSGLVATQPPSATTKAPPVVQPSNCSVENPYVRLMGPSNLKGIGFVEVKLNNQWGSVCDDLWGINEARVVCGMLCYNKDIARAGAPVEVDYVRQNVSVNTLMDDVNCDGDETNILNCRYKTGSAMSQNCIGNRDEFASVSCVELINAPPEEKHLTLSNGQPCSDLVKRTDPNYVSISVPFGKCGTSEQSNETHIIYTNTIRYDYTTQIGNRVRVNLYYVEVSCYFERDLTDNLDKEMQPMSQYVTQKAPGQFRVNMVFFRNNSFLNAETTYPLQLTLGEWLYVGLYLESIGSNLKLVVPNCKATPSTDRNDQTNYPLFINKCAEEDTLAFFPMNTTAFGYRYRTFKFMGFDSVIVHCEAFVCTLNETSASCDRSCNTTTTAATTTTTAASAGRRRRRDVDYHHDTIYVSSPPIVFRRRGNVNGTIIERWDDTTKTAPTTMKPTTAAPTTMKPTTAAPTTMKPTTVPTTRKPTTVPTTQTTTTTKKQTTSAPTTTTAKLKFTTSHKVVKVTNVVTPTPKSHDNINQPGNVKCQDDVRLAGNGSTADRGRVEILRNGIWGTVCDDDFDVNASTVVCRMLGFNNGGYPLGNTIFGGGSGPIWLDSFQCYGHELKLEHCLLTGMGWNNSNCNHSEDASVQCHVLTNRTGSIRLVPPNMGYGYVEVFINGAWGAICNTNWNIYNARVICRMLLFNPSEASAGAPSSVETAWGNVSQAFVMDNLDCSGEEQNILNCTYGSPQACDHTNIHRYARVTCVQFPGSPSIVLVPSLTCTDGQFRANFSKQDQPTLQEQNFILATNVTCNLNKNTMNNFIIISFYFNDCGTVASANVTHITYTNLLIYEKPHNQAGNPPLVTAYSIRLQCEFKRAQNSSIGGIQPITDQVTQVAPGEYKTELQFYTDGTLSTPITSNPLQIVVGVLVYVAVILDTAETNLKIVIQNCFATPDSNRNNPENYPLIRNKCPFDPSLSLSFLPVNTTMIGFVFKSFKFLNYNNVYLHCDVTVCLENETTGQCNRHCARRRRRQDTPMYTDYHVRSPPISFISEIYRGEDKTNISCNINLNMNLFSKYKLYSKGKFLRK
ncbi:hypothetical protein KUTeg_022279 [Tegillarca granosa]|uniref:Deleted in malignant brain tumors 1 protein n=1 Tax=Tegillarca granosa TaxID=220873 RepID=A0ABQ9EB82_TEGGR|nr:hypothetical protein KUTeg_022279 [Tegillarca granosa]